MAVVTKVLRGSVLKGIVTKGDEVSAFGSHPFRDILDYIYADGLSEGTITVKRGDDEEVLSYEKDETETLGLEFDDSIEIKPIECCNNCIFCFVQQLPDGMRDTLYVKDDDYRLSFISGSYITCTNLKEKDIERILEYKLSPLYVSVHATDEDVRKFILGIKRCAPQLPLLRRLIEGGIVLHAQIVLVGGINDGEVLRRSLSDLYEVGVSTVAIVPVGLTGHRQGKYAISPLTKEQAGAAVDCCERFYKEHVGFCYCSDEMYQIAERPVPTAEYYGQFEQIENGVGLIGKFLDELDAELEVLPRKKIKRSVALFTGVSGESTMQEAKKRIQAVFPQIDVEILVVKNRFFGETVTVTGLVTATDILDQYGDRQFTEDYVLIPSVMLKEFEKVFLDGVTVKELSKKIGKRIVVTTCDGYDFVHSVVEGRNKKR